MKYISILLFSITLLGISNFVSAQRQPIDSLFYSDGSIHYIRYKGGESIGNATIRYFKKSFNILDKNQKIVDTIFRNYADSNRLTWYQGPTRIFFPNDSYVTVVRFTKYGSMNDKIFNTINGGYNFIFKELNNLELDISYNNDTNITNIGITGDTIRIVNIMFDKNGSHFSADTILGNFFNCGDFGSIVIMFDNKNLLKNVYLYEKSSNYATYYEFYDNFYCKKYGHYQGNIPTGQWNEYHANGNVSSIGFYCIDSASNTLIKDNHWKYFDKDGLLIKEENYIKGLLEKREK